MQINLSDTLEQHYWDFLTAIESDLKQTSRYVEFSEDNLNTYSIEFTRLYLSTCSEIKVVLKEICKLIRPDSNPTTIIGYRRIIKRFLPEMIDEDVHISFKRKAEPWKDWTSHNSPQWWKDYQSVKHNRNENYHKANLDNVLQAVSALFICVHYFYRLYLNKALEPLLKREFKMKDLTRVYKTGNDFLRLNNKYYSGSLLIN